MKSVTAVLTGMLLVGCASVVLAAENGDGAVRRLSVKEYRDKVKAAWLGKHIGVDWGAPTEFKFKTSIVPEEKIPKYNPNFVNAGFNQDDLYVQISCFVRALDLHGLDITPKQAAMESAISSCGFKCWCSHRAGLTRVAKGGLLPPAAGCHGEQLDLGYQIAGDFSGLMAPGLPNTVVGLGETFGGIINYADGIYAGQFMGGMYAEAFLEKDVNKIIEAGLKCIPAESDYAQCINDCIKWHNENPRDYAKAWQSLYDKWAVKRWEGQEKKRGIGNFGPSIYCSLNGGMIALGLLYGNGDPEQTIVYAVKGGMDSDCNGSNAGGVLFASIGFSNLPETFRKDPDGNRRYNGSEYTFPKLIDVCEKIAREAVQKAGGKVEKGADGDSFLIPIQTPKPSKLMKVTDPEPKGETLTAAEIQQIKEAQASYPWKRK